ncbi:MAG TPA: hypothetical protein VIJ96_03140, partial [Acidothermaceae bacterium]
MAEHNAWPGYGTDEELVELLRTLAQHVRGKRCPSITHLVAELGRECRLCPRATVVILGTTSLTLTSRLFGLRLCGTQGWLVLGFGGVDGVASGGFRRVHG